MPARCILAALNCFRGAAAETWAVVAVIACRNARSSLNSSRFCRQTSDLVWSQAALGSCARIGEFQALVSS